MKFTIHFAPHAGNPLAGNISPHMESPCMARCFVVSTIALLVGLSQYAPAQGPLTPPGAPAPTMKSLDQIYDAVVSSPESTRRNAIRAADLPLTITQAGNYYLAEDIAFTGDAHGITISASDVSIDLNGFTLRGPGKTAATSGSMAIRILDGPTRLTIKNGTVRDWPTAGIAWSNALPSDCQASHVRIFDTGGVALSFGSGAIVEDCLVVGSATSGLNLSDRAVVRRTTVRSSGSSVSSVAFNLGANSVVEDSCAQSNLGRGFAGGIQTQFRQCRAISNGASGFNLADVSDVQFLNCTAESNTDSGFIGGWRNQFIGCTSRGNGQHGIQIQGTSPQGMRIVDSFVSGNGLDGLAAVGSFRGAVLNSHFVLNGNDGIDAGASWYIANNQCNGNGTATNFTTGAGVRAEGASVVRGNVCASNDIGIACSANSSYFASNTLNNNTTAKSLSGSTEGTGDLVNVSF